MNEPNSKACCLFWNQQEIIAAKLKKTSYADAFSGVAARFFPKNVQHGVLPLGSKKGIA